MVARWLNLPKGETGATAQTTADEADHTDSAGVTELEADTAPTIEQHLQVRNHILYADKSFVIGPRQEMDIMLKLPLAMRGKKGILFVDRLPKALLRQVVRE